jgi:hypothetical protein
MFIYERQTSVCRFFVGDYILFAQGIWITTAALVKTTASGLQGFTKIRRFKSYHINNHLFMGCHSATPFWGSLETIFDFNSLPF